MRENELTSFPPTFLCCPGNSQILILWAVLDLRLDLYVYIFHKSIIYVFLLNEIEGFDSYMVLDNLITKLSLLCMPGDCIWVHCFMSSTGC